MKLQFLGTGGYHPNERRHTACVLLPELGIAFDAGTGMFRLPERIGTDELHVCLSHSHLDHVVGLTYLLAPLRLGKLRKVRVYSAPQYLAAVREHLFSAPIFPVWPGFELVPLAERHELPGQCVLTHRVQVHPGGSLGFRLDSPDGSIAYVTDTLADDSAAEFLRGVDVLIHECNFGDNEADWAIKTGHSHLSAVLDLARQARVGRTYLVHFDPRHPGDDPVGLLARAATEPHVHLAEDLLTIDI